MRRPRARLVLGLGVPLLVVLMLLAAWAIDSSSASGKVPRNVTLAGRDIGKFPEDRLAATVADLADHYATTTVQVRTDGETYKARAADLGLKLDQQATVNAALELDEESSLPARPLEWASSFLDDREAPLRFTVDVAALDSGLGELPGNAASTEPSLVSGAEAITVVSGSDGQKIDPDGVKEQLLRRAESGEEPIIVNAEVSTMAPTVSDADAQQVADRLNQATANGLAVTAGSHKATIPPATVRSWISSTVQDGTLVVSLDEEKTKAGLVDAIPVSSEPRNAAITLTGGAIQIAPSANGERCCAEDSVERVQAALDAGEGAVTIDMVVAEPDLTTEEAQKLGIKEPVGTTTEWNGQPQVKSFTTYYSAGGGGRVTNIHRIADLVNGTIVMPGETFSVNGTVGQRTKAKGFVEAGAIANGEHVDEVGGGVSQFATTMFNAAFFAGLPFGEYQAHSEHFARYPFGREATMGWEHPDLQWKNDTPYGILIEATHTPGSVTVRLWSTQYAWGEQTGQTTGRSGSCTTVSTQRTIHYQDGRTGTDTVRARYRDPGKTSC